MTPTINDIDFLASAQGEQLLARLAAENLSDSNTLRLITALRKDYTAPQASVALEMARLRLKAVDKFGGDAQRMFFTRDALEQASDPLARGYRALTMGSKSLVDACCGIGADTLAFTHNSGNVLGLDLDPVRIAIARHNNDALGLAARFEAADVTAGLPDAGAVFFDPARRDKQGKRIYDVEQYQPPLSTIRGWKHPHIVVKLSPGVDLAQVKDYGGMVEFVSVDGELKEAVLWLHQDRSAFETTAALLGRDGSIAHWSAAEPVEVPITEPRAWLVEPDPALIRAGLVQNVTAEFEGSMLDETIAYFTADERPDSQWIRAWKIIDWMPFNLKKLRAYLNERNVGRVTVKKRGSAITPEELIAKLKLKGQNSRTVVLTRCKGAYIVLICEDFALA